MSALGWAHCPGSCSWCQSRASHLEPGRARRSKYVGGCLPSSDMPSSYPVPSCRTPKPSSYCLHTHSRPPLHHSSHNGLWSLFFWSFLKHQSQNMTVLCSRTLGPCISFKSAKRQWPCPVGSQGGKSEMLCVHAETHDFLVSPQYLAQCGEHQERPSPEYSG